LGFGGNNGNNNNGDKTGAIHGPLMIDEGISLVAFRGIFVIGWLVVCGNFSSSFLYTSL
jgi:hypothetical protein